MSKAHQNLEKDVRIALSEHFPKTIFKLNTFKPTLAGGRRSPYRVHGKILYVEFFVEHLKEKGINEKDVRAIIEGVLHSPVNETNVSRVVFKRKNAPVNVSNVRLERLKTDLAELIEDEDNTEIVLQTLQILARSLSRNDSEMVMNVLADYNEEKI